MKSKILPSILGKNNKYLQKYPVLGQGGFSIVYELVDYNNLILKHSYNPMDGFRFLADMTAAKRNKIGLRPIEERKIYGDDIYYLLPKLNKIDFTGKELEYLNAINEIDNPITFFMFEDFISERMSIIQSKIKALLLTLKDEVYELDISEENIMQDENGNIYLTDPVAEML